MGGLGSRVFRRLAQASLTTASLWQLLPPKARVLRVSPNLPCIVQEGAMVMARGRHAGSYEAQLLRSLLEACGQCEEVPEAQVDIHTGLSGSGVAFVSVVGSPPSAKWDLPKPLQQPLPPGIHACSSAARVCPPHISAFLGL